MTNKLTEFITGIEFNTTMSSQHKLYNYEVAPPAEAWERIAQELEGVNDFRNVSQKLQNLQVAPPAFAWNNISGELDDQKSFDIIAQKLSAAEVTPPTVMWSKIEEELDSALPAVKKETPVIPLNKRLSKYAAAAAVIGILGLSAFFLAKRSSQDVAVIRQTFADNSSSIKNTEAPILQTHPQNKVKTTQAAALVDSSKRSAALAMTVPSENDGIVTL